MIFLSSLPYVRTKTDLKQRRTTCTTFIVKVYRKDRKTISLLLMRIYSLLIEKTCFTILLKKNVNKRIAVLLHFKTVFLLTELKELKENRMFYSLCPKLPRFYVQLYCQYSWTCKCNTLTVKRAIIKSTVWRFGIFQLTSRAFFAVLLVKEGQHFVRQIKIALFIFFFYHFGNPLYQTWSKFKNNIQDTF